MFAYLNVRVSERGERENLLFIGSLLSWLRWPEEFHVALLREWNRATCLVCLPLLFPHTLISIELDRKSSSWDTVTHIGPSLGHSSDL